MTLKLLGGADKHNSPESSPLLWTCTRAHSPETRRGSNRLRVSRVEDARDDQGGHSTGSRAAEASLERRSEGDELGNPRLSLTDG